MAVPVPRTSQVEVDIAMLAFISVVPDMTNASLFTIEPLAVLKVTVGAMESCVTETLPELEFPAASVVVIPRIFTAFG